MFVNPIQLEPSDPEESCSAAMIQLAAELIEQLDETDWEWRVPFLVARRLRNYGTNPATFGREIQMFWEETQEYLESSYESGAELNADITAVWDKVTYPEGEDFFSLACSAADQQPVENAWSQFGETFASLASLAFYMSQAAQTTAEAQSPPVFALPQERIARWLGKSQVRISRTITVLQRERVITRVSAGSYTKRCAAEFTLSARITRRANRIYLSSAAS